MRYGMRQISVKYDRGTKGKAHNNLSSRICLQAHACRVYVSGHCPLISTKNLTVDFQRDMIKVVGREYGSQNIF